MSKFNLIAVAIAASLAAPAAFATSVTVGAGPATPEVLPVNAFINNGVIAANFTKEVKIVANATSVYLGRTTGYNVRLTLGQGVFNNNPEATPTGGTVSSSLAGGGAGANTATYTVNPATTGVTAGAGIIFAPNAIEVRGLSALATGGSVTLAVQVFDPVGGNQLGETINANLISTAQGFVVSFAPGDADQRIDVGAASAKRWFGNTTVGSGTAATKFNAGKLGVTLATSLTNFMGLDLANATAPVVISGTDFSAFKVVGTGTAGKVYLASDATCATAGSINAVVAANNQSASVAAATTAAAVNATSFVCFDSNNVTTIAAQPISSSVAVGQVNFNTAPIATAALQPMTFNGSVVQVRHFNPASNADQQSYVRVSNLSANAGLVSVSGICDNGVATPGTATFTLGAGQSRLLTSQTLESGVGLTTAMGSCPVPGKTRLTVTGEFAPMAVQNFLRNSTSAGLINTNVNNEN